MNVPKLQHMLRIRRFVLENLDRTETAMREISMDERIRVRRQDFLANLRVHVEANRWVSIAQLDYFIDLVELICVICGAKAVHRVGLEGFCKTHAPDARTKREDISKWLDHRAAPLSDALTQRDHQLRRKERSRRPVLGGSKRYR